MNIVLNQPLPSQVSYASVDAAMSYDIETDLFTVDLQGILTTGDRRRIFLVRNGQLVRIDRVEYTGVELDAQIATGDTRVQAHQALIKSKAAEQIPA